MSSGHRASEFEHGGRQDGDAVLAVPFQLWSTSSSGLDGLVLVLAHGCSAPSRMS